MSDKIEPVGHLHSNGDCCQDRKVISDFWPVNLYSQPQMDALVAERDALREYKADTDDLRRILGVSPSAKLVIELDTLRDRLKRAEAEAAALVEFFRGEGYQAFGWDGDVAGLSPADTAIKAMRSLLEMRSACMRITLVDRGGGALAIRHWHNDADLPAGDYVLYAKPVNSEVSNA